MSIESINRKDTTRYRAVVRIGRKKISKTFSTKRDAKAWEGKMVGNGPSSREVSLLTKPQNPISLEQLMTRFEKDHSKIRNAPSTQLMNRSLYDMYLAKQFGESSLGNLSSQVFEAYFLHLHNDTQVSNDRVNRIRQLLHVMFAKAVRWKYLPANPITSLEKLPGTDFFSSERIKFLTKDEADRLMEWLRVNGPWLYPKVVVLLHTGLRYGEMSALRVRDVCFSIGSPYLSVSRSRCRYTGGFELTKGKRGRMLPLSPGFMEFLRPLTVGKKPDDPLMWKDWNEGRWATKAYKHFLKAIREAKVSQITTHDLRHTYAVRFLENGGNIFDLKELLGHRDIKTTMRYSHFSPAMAERARGIVDFERPTPQLAVVDGGLL